MYATTINGSADLSSVQNYPKAFGLTRLCETCIITNSPEKKAKAINIVLNLIRAGCVTRNVSFCKITRNSDPRLVQKCDTFVVIFVRKCRSQREKKSAHCVAAFMSKSCKGRETGRHQRREVVVTSHF